MTSLIFWGPYLAHKGYIDRRREKQRVKNYERWEGLRDEYDEQRKISRETRSLDIQRPGWDEPGIFTLRDQQEANDARTTWRPQEAWDAPRTQMQAQMTGQQQQYQQAHPQDYQQQQYAQQYHEQRRASAAPSFGHLPLKAQKTGATWDEGLPERMQVSRRSFDDYEQRETRSGNVSRQESRNASRQQSVSRTHTPSGLREQYVPVQVTTIHEMPKNEFGFVEPTIVSAPGGRMAELIERGY